MVLSDEKCNTDFELTWSLALQADRIIDLPQLEVELATNRFVVDLARLRVRVLL